MDGFWIGLLIAILTVAFYSPYCALLNLNKIADELERIREYLEKKEAE